VSMRVIDDEDAEVEHGEGEEGGNGGSDDDE
jgi:hypothetical protein